MALAVSKLDVDEKLLVRDEWTNEDVPFSNESDALLAALALSKDADPAIVDRFFSLLRNPAFKPSECSLHSVADVHSFASNHRKQTKNSIAGDAYALNVPAFVWQEVILRIGDQWFAYASHIFGKSIHEKPFWDGDTVSLIPGHRTLLDLRCASLVHRSWTRPAQRQMGRVLVLDTARETTLSAAIQSTMYGNWTQIIGLKLSPPHVSEDTWGNWGSMSAPDDFTSNRARLKSFVARFPFITSLFFDSAGPGHAMQLLDLAKTSNALTSVTIVNSDPRINNSTADVVVECARRWPGLKLNLVGFGIDFNAQDHEDAVERLTSSPEMSTLSSLFVSGGVFNLHGGALIHRVTLERETRLDGTVHAIVREAHFRRIHASTPIHGAPFAETTFDGNPVDFSTLANEICLSWLPKIERIHLTSIYETEGDEILRIATSVRHLSWSGAWFTTAAS